MRLVILFYTVLFALLHLVLALPNFNYAVRSDVTLVSDNTTLNLDTAAGATEKRANSLLAAGLSSPWPELLYNGHRIRPITYCYTNKAIRDRLECNVISFAVGLWVTKLNSRRFSGTTNVRFEEAHDRASGTVHYCFDDQGHWNANVHDDVLWVDIQGTNVETGWSTVGWYPPTLGGGGRHKMYLAELNNPAQMTDIVTHEIGHVLSMAHEFQRSDRDDFVLYICINLRNYDYAFNRARADNPLMNDKDLEWHLCNDQVFAKRYGILSPLFLKRDSGHSVDEPEPYLGFDVDSITMYETESISNPRCLMEEDYCALRKCQRTAAGARDLSRPPLKIQQPLWPSDRDARWVQKWYPAP